MEARIRIKLYASLSKFTPADSKNYPVEKGINIQRLLERLKVPKDDVKLIFINHVKGNLSSILQGGECVGIFPPIGGG